MKNEKKKKKERKKNEFSIAISFCKDDIVNYNIIIVTLCTLYIPP